MTNYWLRIAFGIVVIFAIGMGIHSVVGGFKHKISETSDPISIPIAFVPFKLNGEKLGDIDKISLLRDDPKHISSVQVVISLADSHSVARLRDCQVAIDDVEGLNERSTFRCQTGDTASSGLLPFGVVVLRGTDESFPLLLPEKAVKDLRDASFQLDGHGFTVESRSDSLDEARDRQADSVENAAERRTDSISADASRLADSIRNGRGIPPAPVEAAAPKDPVKVKVRKKP